LGGGDVVGVAGHAGNGARRDAAVGNQITLVAAVRSVAVCRSDQLTAVDRHFEFQFSGSGAGGAFRKQQIGQHNARKLEFVDEVEHFGDNLEAVDDIGWSGDGSGVVA